MGSQNISFIQPDRVRTTQIECQLSTGIVEATFIRTQQLRDKVKTVRVVCNQSAATTISATGKTLATLAATYGNAYLKLVNRKTEEVKLIAFQTITKYPAALEGHIEFYADTEDVRNVDWDKSSVVWGNNTCVAAGDDGKWIQLEVDYTLD